MASHYCALGHRCQADRLTLLKNPWYEPSDPDPPVLHARHGLGYTIKFANGMTQNYSFQGTVDGELTNYVTLNRRDQITQIQHAGGTNPSQSGTYANGTPWWCGVDRGDACYRYSGQGGSVSITPLQGKLVLSVDSTEVASGSTVKFTMDSSVVEGQRLPIVADSVRWIPDRDSEGGEYSEAQPQGACTWINPLQSTRRILGDGRLEIVGRVNGTRHVVSQAVKVRTPHLRLVGSKLSVAKGENVTFTATWSDGITVTNAEVWQWKFRPDSGTDITGQCGQWNPCTRAIQQSGTMTLTASKNGVLRTARTRVNVVPCPTNDTILDNPKIRKALDSLWKLSDVTAQYPMHAYDSLGTTIVRIGDFNPLTDDGCTNYPRPPQPPPGFPVAWFHTHPASVNQTVNCNPKQSKVYSKQFGGPSHLDWQHAANNAPQFVMDADNIYRMDKYPWQFQYWDEGTTKSGGKTLVPQDSLWKPLYKEHPRKVDGCTRV